MNLKRSNNFRMFSRFMKKKGREIESRRARSETYSILDKYQQTYKTPWNSQTCLEVTLKCWPQTIQFTVVHEALLVAAVCRLWHSVMASLVELRWVWMTMHHLLLTSSLVSSISPTDTIRYLYDGEACWFELEVLWLISNPRNLISNRKKFILLGSASGNASSPLIPMTPKMVIRKSKTIWPV